MSPRAAFYRRGIIVFGRVIVEKLAGVCVCSQIAASTVPDGFHCIQWRQIWDNYLYCVRYDSEARWMCDLPSRGLTSVTLVVVGHLASLEIDSAGTTYRHCQCVSVGQLKSRK